MMSNAGRIVKSKYRAHQTGKAAVGLDALDQRYAQNQTILQLRAELLAECGGEQEATAKEKALIETACFVLLRQMRANDRLLETGDENERREDAALRSAGIISRIVEDLRTCVQLRQAAQQANRRAVVQIPGKSDDEALGPDDTLIRIIPVTPQPQPGDVPRGSFEQDAAAARASLDVAPTPIVRAPTTAGTWAALVADESAPTSAEPSREAEVIPFEPASGGSGGFDTFNQSLYGDDGRRARLGPPLKVGERRVLCGERRGVSHFSADDRHNVWRPRGE